jgi:hypothetical protein
VVWRGRRRSQVESIAAAVRAKAPAAAAVGPETGPPASWLWHPGSGMACGSRTCRRPAWTAAAIPPASLPRDTDQCHVECPRDLVRGRPDQPCSHLGEPRERREVARAEDGRRQGALGAECAEVRPARAKVRPAAGRGCRRVRSSRRGYHRGAGARRSHRPRWSVLGARRGARCRPCSRGTSRSPPGASRGQIALRPSCSRSAAALPAGSDSPCLAAGLGIARLLGMGPDPFPSGDGGPSPLPAAKRPQRPALVRDSLQEPAPTSVVGALRPTAIAAR